MKSRFNTYDIVCMVTELQKLIGMRVNQVYDIDNKSYLIRLQLYEEKAVLLLESGNRFHTTDFEWPKNVAPSGFTMKLRKHLKNKRLEKLTQLGIDRIVDMQFGTGEAAYHVILELYDRGNIVLTDCEMNILNVLRPHVEGDKIRFAVKEKYPLDRAKLWSDPPLGDDLRRIISSSKPGDNLKKLLNPNVEYGPAIIDHVLLQSGLSGTMKVTTDPNKGFCADSHIDKLETALKLADELLQKAQSEVAKGYIIQKKEERPSPEGGEPTYFHTNVEFHPYKFQQHTDLPIVEYETFNKAVDEFFSAAEGQKIDLKTIQVEREAMKKLQNVRKDHVKRLTELERSQQADRDKAELITRNQQLVDDARIAVQNALANQMSWDSIKLFLKTAQEHNDPIASVIKHLKLNMNHITLQLTDPFADGDENDLGPMMVDIDLNLTAYANARRYYDQKRSAAVKQQKTIESQGKALKSAERKTKQTLKEAQTISNINKARKTYWFEKFFWFISSDNYLVIAGRDQQQNELLVKRYMRTTDLYVHADVSGAASVIIKNPSSNPVPPRTLTEAGHAAVAYSVAWEAKVLTSAWWVHASQVSKSAPTGEYLSTGSFMIRGKKNFLLPQQLQLGFGFMFRLEDGSMERHKDDRKPLVFEDSASDVASDVTSVQENEEEIVVSDGEDDEEDDKKCDEVKKDELDTIAEEVDKAKIDDENADNDDNSDTDSENAFPNTHIKIDHGTGKVILESNRTSESSEHIEEKLSFPALPKKKQKKPQPVKKEEKQEKGMKRGQKGKLKKIKEKYKDQDEEERMMIQEMLKVAQQKETKKAAKKNSAVPVKPKGPKGPKIPQPAPLLLEAESDGEVETEEIEPDREPKDGGGADIELLNQLTGCPVTEDELLFAVPVVAPYSALHHFKYKVKLTPGTSKRGKAAKTAVQVFVKDTSCTQREKDLLKAVKEENIARNFPGKVRLSAPQLHKHKK